MNSDPPTVPAISPPFSAASWEAFESDWCLNSRLGYEREVIAASLYAVQRMLPARLDALMSNSGRGPAIVVPVVEVGRMLAACEHLPSFGEVLHRLKGGERSAYSELVLVSALNALGYPAVFAPPLDGRVLDAECCVEEHRVLFEVVVPDRSDANVTRQQAVSLLSAQLQKTISACRVEIEVMDRFSIGDIQAVIDAVAKSPARVWVEVPETARLRRTNAGQPLMPLFDSPEGMQITFGGRSEVQDASASIVIRDEAEDARAKRIFNEEYHQFSSEVPNVLVVDVCAVTDGMKKWPTHMSRLLQPKRNRRVGAVAFFDQGVLGPPERIRRRWRVLVNPYAHHTVPEPLLSALESLDESEHYGIPRYPRLVASSNYSQVSSLCMG